MFNIQLIENPAYHEVDDLLECRGIMVETGIGGHDHNTHATQLEHVLQVDI